MSKSLTTRQKNNLKVSKSEIDGEFLLIKAVNNSFYEDERTTEKEWKDQIRYNILLEDLLTKDIDISNKERNHSIIKIKNCISLMIRIEFGTLL